MKTKTKRPVANARKPAVKPAKRNAAKTPIVQPAASPVSSDFETLESSPPREIRFGTFKKRIRNPHEIPVVVANWLIDQGKAVQNFENFVHAGNIGFKATATTIRLNSGQFMEVGDDQKDLLRKARILLDSSGYRGRPIEVLLEDGSQLTA